MDSEEIIRKDWMFKLVGQESFTFGPSSKPHRGVIRIDPMGTYVAEWVQWFRIHCTSDMYIDEGFDY